MPVSLLRNLLVASLLATLAACATPQPAAHKTAPARSSDGAPYDFKREGKVPPVTGADARTEADVEELPVEQERIESSDAEAPPVDSTRVPAARDSVADGFRVQVFASSDREVAENARVVAEQRLHLPGYLELENGVYKVRVGDFVGRPDAEKALTMIRSTQYSDAWITPSKVRVSAPHTP